MTQINNQIFSKNHLSTSGAKVKKEMREYVYGSRWMDDVVSVRHRVYERVGGVDVVKSQGEYYYEKDHLGSIIRITSSTGAVVDEYSYTLFGKAYKKNTLGVYKPVSGSNKSEIGNTRMFTGREYDREAGLYYMRARYYDSGLGRFISRDPIGTGDNVNLYTYVANSPLNYIDRMGREKQPVSKERFWSIKSIDITNKFNKTLSANAKIMEEYSSIRDNITDS